MKLHTVLLAAAVLLASSCFEEHHEGQTLVQCRFTGDIPDSVRFTIGDQWDTTVAVGKSMVKVLLPVDTSTVAFMVAGDGHVGFVSDGSSIRINPAEGSAVSDNPAGVNSRMQELSRWEEEYMAGFNARLDALPEAEQDAYIDASLAEYNDYHFSVLEDNRENVVGLLALSSIQRADEEKMLSALRSLGGAVALDPFVDKMTKLYEAKVRTAPGSRFVDFTIVQDLEKPRKSTVSLSDYVGKGKYVLVDFWASWCGPCKAEIPYIKEVYKKHKGRHFNVLSVAVWDKPDATRQAARELGINWDQIVNAQDIPTDLYGIEGIPHLILFGPDGTIVARDIRGEGIEEAVSAALESAGKK